MTPRHLCRICGQRIRALLPAKRCYCLHCAGKIAHELRLARKEKAA